MGRQGKWRMRRTHVRRDVRPPHRHTANAKGHAQLKRPRYKYGVAAEGDAGSTKGWLRRHAPRGQCSRHPSTFAMPRQRPRRAASGGRLGAGRRRCWAAESVIFAVDRPCRGTGVVGPASCRPRRNIQLGAQQVPTVSNVDTGSTRRTRVSADSWRLPQAVLPPLTSDVVGQRTHRRPRRRVQLGAEQVVRVHANGRAPSDVAGAW